MQQCAVKEGGRTVTSDPCQYTVCSLGGDNRLSCANELKTNGGGDRVAVLCFDTCSFPALAV